MSPDHLAARIGTVLALHAGSALADLGHVKDTSSGREGTCLRCTVPGYQGV